MAENEQSDDDVDQQSRRQLLQVRANRKEKLDYLIIMSGRITIEGGTDIDVELRYVPHRYVAEPSVFDAYWQAVGAAAPDEPELLASLVIDDINNEVVPRWVQIIVRPVVLTGDTAAGMTTIMMEDCQPKWQGADRFRRTV